jgi:NTE family protein
VRRAERLDRLWTQVGEIGDFRMLPWMAAFLPALALLADGQCGLPALFAAGVAAQLYSPYALLGSRWRNPLEPVVRDLTSARSAPRAGPKLFVSATNVRTGKIKVFRGKEITPDAILASACLPTVFQTVEIDGEAYWDGGYSGNPALFPLYEPDLPDDILVVSINPLRTEECRTRPLEIQNRINEISFNASLLGELAGHQLRPPPDRRGPDGAGRMKAVNMST